MKAGRVLGGVCKRRRKVINTVNMSIALIGYQAQGGAAAAGLEMKPETQAGTGEAVAESFQKKLKDCGIMTVPAQQTAADNSQENLETGTAEGSGTVEAFPGAAPVPEGIGTPVNPQSAAQSQAEEAVTPENLLPSSGGQETGAAEGSQADEGTSEFIARMQTAETGAIPGKTQDQILEAVGAYIDAAADTEGRGTGSQVQGAEDCPAPEQSPATRQGEVPGNAGAQAGAESAGTDAAAQPVIGGNAERSAGETEGSAEEAESAQTMTAKRSAQRQTSVSDGAEDTQNVSAARADMGAAEKASETMPEAAPEAKQAVETQNAKENVLRIVDSVSTQSEKGRYEFEVNLKPDFLGKVRIKLTMENGSIRMLIKTDDQSVRGMLSDQTTALQSALKEKGVLLSNVDVTYESQTPTDAGGRSSGQNGGSGRQTAGGSALNNAAQAEPSDGGILTEPYGCCSWNSTVEYYA